MKKNRLIAAVAAAALVVSGLAGVREFGFNRKCTDRSGGNGDGKQCPKVFGSRK